MPILLPGHGSGKFIRDAIKDMDYYPEHLFTPDLI